MPILQRGQRVGSGEEAGRWIVTRKLGEGQFAEVYEVRDSSMRDADVRYAMKIEKRRDVRSVKAEHRVLRRLSASCPQVCPLITAGIHEDRHYMVLQLLGSNLAQVRRVLGGPGGGLPPGCVRRAALAMLDALQAVHAAGFIHRDVKPANFASCLGATAGPGPGGALLSASAAAAALEAEWRLVDFGLARRFVDDAGGLLPARPGAAFRGSTTYASVHAHAGLDLGRRDDCWSWLYCVAELLEGTLPWRQDAQGQGQAGQSGKAHQGSDGGAGQVAAAVGTQAGPSARDAAAQLKQQCIASPQLLARNVPEAGTSVLAAMSSHLAGLAFGDAPDYGLLRAQVARLPDAWGAHAWGGGSAAATAAACCTGAEGQGAAAPAPPLPPPELLAEGVALGRAMAGPGAGEAQQQRRQRDTPASPSRRTPLSPGEPQAWGAWGNGPAGYDAAQQQDGGQGEGGATGKRARVSGTAADAAPYAHLPGEPPLTPAQAQAQASALEHVAQHLDALRGGAVGARAEGLAAALGALPPADALAVAAAVLGAAVGATPPATCNALGALLRDVASYAGAAAQAADARYAQAAAEAAAAQQQQMAAEAAAAAAAGGGKAAGQGGQGFYEAYYYPQHHHQQQQQQAGAMPPPPPPLPPAHHMTPTPPSLPSPFDHHPQQGYPHQQQEQQHLPSAQWHQQQQQQLYAQQPQQQQQYYSTHHGADMAQYHPQQHTMHYG